MLLGRLSECESVPKSENFIRESACEASPNHEGFQVRKEHRSGGEADPKAERPAAWKAERESEEHREG